MRISDWSSDVCSSDLALFGCNPWLTEFELWHRKAGNVATPDFAHNERTFWGTILEPVILAAASERYGYQPLETPKRLDHGKGQIGSASCREGGGQYV